jgi:hypothetical protein
MSDTAFASRQPTRPVGRRGAMGDPRRQPESGRRDSGIPGTRKPLRNSRPPNGSPRRRIVSLIGLAQILSAGLIYLGWSIRDERWVIPDRGLGYWLGIAGLAAMVILLVYPLRKHVRGLRRAGRISTWFQFHMLLGLLGPVAILYHSNFRLGSTNANVALFCVLAVAGSGVVGRVLYVRIHAGLEGRRRTLAEVREEVEKSQLTLVHIEGSEQIVGRLAKYERAMLGADGTGRARWLPRLGARRAGKRTLRDVKRLLAKGKGRPAHTRAADRAAWKAAKRYVGAVRSVIQFQLWERWFALWHVAHLPLSFLLFATAAVHVVAVHLY